MSRATIISWFRQAHPDHRAIARGLAMGAFFIFLGKLAGAAKEMAIAWRYGVSEVVDAYLFIFNLVTWPVAVWFGVLGVVLVPLAATVRERDPKELIRFRAELLGFTLIVGLVLLALARFGLPIFLNSSLSGLSGSALNHALDIVPALAWLVFLGMPISLFSAWVTAANRHSNTLFEGIPAFVILIIVLVSSGTGPAALVWGTLAGFVFHLASLAASQVRWGELEPPLFVRHSTQWASFWRAFAIMSAGQTAASLTNIVDQLFASHLGAGSISTLNYANRIVALILGLGATAVGRATLPVFSRAQAQGLTHVRGMAMRWSQLLFGLGVAAVLVSSWLAPWLVKILFERGAFTARDTQTVTEVLRYALVQVPFFFSSLVLVSCVSSRNNYMPILISGIIGLTVKIAANALLVPWMALNGLALSNAVVYGCSAGFLAASVKWGKR